MFLSLHGFQKEGGLVLNGYLDQRLQIGEFREEVKSPGSRQTLGESEDQGLWYSREAASGGGG